MHRREMALLQKHFTARPGAPSNQGSGKWDMASTDSRASTVVGTGVHYIGEVNLGLQPGSDHADYSSLLCGSLTTPPASATLTGIRSEPAKELPFLRYYESDNDIAVTDGSVAVLLSGGYIEPQLDIIEEGDIQLQGGLTESTRLEI